MSRSESFPGVEPELAETRSDVRARRPAVRRQAQTVSGQQDGRRVRGHRCESERSGGTEDSNPGQTKAVDSSGSRQRPDGIARESLGRQPWALRRGRACQPVFRSPSPSVGSDGRRQGRKGSQGRRTALITASFGSGSAGDPAGPGTRSVPKPSGGAGGEPLPPASGGSCGRGEVAGNRAAAAVMLPRQLTARG